MEENGPIVDGRNDVYIEVCSGAGNRSIKLA